MPFFKGDFSTEELQVMRSATADCAKLLGVEGNVDRERDIAIGILTAAKSGKRSLADLVAAGLAAGRGSLTS
jgi:hypothetical protein